MSAEKVLGFVAAALFTSSSALSLQASVIVDSRLVAWWDASDINNDGGVNNPRRGALVTNWRDKSVHGRDLNAGSGGTYSPGSIGGQPAVRFSTQQWLYTAEQITAEQLTGTDRNEMTIFMVLNKYPDDLGYWTSWQTAVTNRVLFGGRNRWDFVNDGAGQMTGGRISGFWTIFEGLKSSTTQSISLRGGRRVQQPNTLGLARRSSANFIVGAVNTGNSMSAGVDFAELIVYNRALSTAERNQIGFYLGNKYGIPTEYIPEPNSAALLGLCGFGVFTGRRRQVDDAHSH